MRSRRYLPLMLGVMMLLSACTSSSPLYGAAPANGHTVESGVTRAAGKAGPALYVLNSKSSPAYSVSVYSGGGASHLRNVPIGEGSNGFTVDGSRLYAGSPTSLGSSLEIYSSRGAKLVRTLTQKKPFGFLTLDPTGNLFTECRPDEVCEYADAKQHIIRRIAFNKFNFTFYALATDHLGDLAAASIQSGVLVFAPGKATPYWTVNKSMVGPIAFDSEGNLYVGLQNCCSQTSVEIYLPGSQSPTRTITTGITEPLYLVLDANDNLYVLNRGVVQSGECSEPTEITVYPPGGTSPSRTISSGLQCDASRMLAVDPLGNIYVPNYFTSGNPSGNVVVYAPGSDLPMRTVTKAISNPADLGVGP